MPLGFIQALEGNQLKIHICTLCTHVIPGISRGKGGGKILMAEASYWPSMVQSVFINLAAVRAY